MKKICLVLIFLFFFAGTLWCEKTQEAEQTIADFNLSGFGEQGKKSWEISGKSADIFSDVVKLKDITGNLYGEKEDINLKAQEGSFNKEKALVHLEKDVVITTSGGAQLTTDSLDWDRKNQVISTQDEVNIKKEDMTTTAKGALGHPNLNKISLEKDVTLEINPAQGQNKDKDAAGQKKIVITCDGPLEIDYQSNIAVFKNNVKVEQKDVLIYSDVMDVYFAMSDKSKTAPANETASVMGANLNKIVCKGNVKIVRGENVSYSDEAVYTSADKKIVLTGTPKLVIYSTEDLNAAVGN